MFHRPDHKGHHHLLGLERQKENLNNESGKKSQKRQLEEKAASSGGKCVDGRESKMLEDDYENSECEKSLRRGKIDSADATGFELV